jgi:hypothetical protein
MKRFSLCIVVIVTMACPSFGQTVLDRLADTLAAHNIKSGPSRNSGRNLPFAIDAGFVSSDKTFGVVINSKQIVDAFFRSRAIEEYGKGAGSASGYRPAGSLSGLSLGQNSFHGGTEGCYDLWVVCDRYDLMVVVTANKKGTPSEVALRRAFGKTLCERLARQIIADAMALDLDDNAKPTATAHLTGLETNKEGYSTLDAWSKSRGVTVAIDASTASATFSRQGKSVRLLLATDKAIVNGKEVGLVGKFILARGSKWFVPSAELEAAISLG